MKGINFIITFFILFQRLYQPFQKEDFADFMGYKLAYYSFLNSEKKAADDKPLPGLNYTARQIFWIASASKWCSEDAFERAPNFLCSPNYLRVLLPLSNLLEFARDFKCPVGSPMNPVNKCNFL